VTINVTLAVQRNCMVVPKLRPIRWGLGMPTIKS